MGLFDRLKKAFKHDKKQDEIKQNLELDKNEDEEVLEQDFTQERKEENQVLDNQIDDDNDKTTDIDKTDEENLAQDEEALELEENSDATVKVDETSELKIDVEQVAANQEEIIQKDDVNLDKGKEDIVSQDVEDNIEKLDNQDVKEIDEDLVGQNINKNSEELVDSQENIEEEIIQDKPKSEKYDKGLEKTRKSFGERLNELFANFRRVDEDFFDELEETLILSDVGLDTAVKLTEELRYEVKLKNAKKPRDVQNTIIEKLVDIYEMEGEVENKQNLNLQTTGLSVILFVGVNGAGKTTTIGKMAYQFKEEGKKVLLAAADTFRAGAINQLIEWGKRSDVEVVSGKEGGDPAAVVYDAVKKAKAENADILLVDTAGRLQNKENLMRELNKIKRVIQKEIPDAPHEVLLVIDATTGQNALIQAKKFKETTDVTGLILTKLDGTAKGGIILAIRNELKLPVKYVGLGEKIDDLAPFDSEQFVYGLFKDLWIED